MVDPGAQDLNKLQIRKLLEHSGRILPDAGRDNVRRVGVFRTRPDRERRERLLEFGWPTRIAGFAIE